MSAFSALALALMTTAPAPAWLDGEWTPYSNAFLGLEGLTITHDTLTWHGCKNVHFDMSDAKDNEVTIHLASDSQCTLNTVKRSRMDTVRFKLRENKCDLGVEIFPSREAMAKNEPSATGLYGKPKCPSGPGNHAAASFSTTAR